MDKCNCWNCKKEIKGNIYWDGGKTYCSNKCRAEDLEKTIFVEIV